MKYENVVRAIVSRPWAIDPDSVAWGAILDVLALRAAGGALSDEEIEARIAAAGNGPRQGGSRQRNVAVIPVYGVISPRGNMMARSSGGMSAESIRDEFRAALADQDVDGIVFDVDSPGGVVEGIDELAAEIRAARGTKPIAAVANHTMASAAYWLASAVDEIVATPSATVGSIGVFTAHQDVSAAMERAGVKTTLIKAGKYKAEGSQFEPLSDDALAEKQSNVDEWYGMMTRSIAAGRGVSTDVVRGASYGEGRAFLAKKAEANGLVDRIGSLEETVRRVARGAITSRPAGRDTNATLIVPVDGDVLVGAGSAETFAARIEAASAENRAIREALAARAALRAEAGRKPSEADLRALASLEASLADDQADEDEEETTEDEVDETAAPEGSVAPAKRLGLELFEAATSRGYALPH